MNFAKICETLIPIVFAVWIYEVYDWTYYPCETVLEWIVKRGIFANTSLFLLVLIDIYRQKPYGNMTLRVLASRYFIILFMRILGPISFRKIAKASKNLKEQQEKCLIDILQRQSETEYGRKYDFKQIKSVAEFRSKHPVTTYSHYEDFVQRTIDGEKNVLSTEDVVFIGMTSGTTGKNKIYPIFISVSKAYMTIFASVFYSCSKKYPNYLSLRSTIGVRVPKLLQERNGIKIGPVSAMSQDSVFNETGTTPGQLTKNIYDESTIMYIHAVFGLNDREVEKMDLSFVSLARSFFYCIEMNWESICDDIENGRLKVDLPKSTKSALEAYLFPNPERAQELRREFKKGFQDIAPRVWPHLAYVTMLTSGPLAVQGKALQKRYLGQTEVLSYVHISTEGLYGVNLDPGRVTPNYYTLLPIFAFLEFIPLSQCDEEEPETVLIHELQLDEEYEIVVTNMSGLYRYRSGDVIKIVSFYNEIPQYDFRFRLGQMLNVNGERSSENAVQTAVEKLMTDLDGTELVDYTSVENSGIDEIPELKDTEKLRYYIVFIEIDNDYTLTDTEKAKFDEYLCEENEWYAQGRQQNAISPASVFQMKKGTFLQLKQKILQENYGTAAVQFKMPRVQRKVNLLKFLAENRIKND